MKIKLKLCRESLKLIVYNRIKFKLSKHRKEICDGGDPWLQQVLRKFTAISAWIAIDICIYHICYQMWQTNYVWDHRVQQCIYQCQVQSSAVITRFNIVRYYINNYRNWGRILIRCWIHKRHFIPRPNGLAMGCLFVNICGKIDLIIRAPHCICICVNANMNSYIHHV